MLAKYEKKTPRWRGPFGKEQKVYLSNLFQNDNDANDTIKLQKFYTKIDNLVEKFGFGCPFFRMH